MNGLELELKGLEHDVITVRGVKYYRGTVHSFSTLKIQFIFYSADSLRQEALVSDTSLIVLPHKQNGGSSLRQNRTWHELWQLCVSADVSLPLKAQVQPPKWGLRLMKGVQTRIDCQKSASNTLVVDLALYKITLHYITLHIQKIMHSGEKVDIQN